MLVQPLRARADGGQIERILTGLQNLRRGEVITGADQKSRKLAPTQYGFDNPRARITVGDSLHRQTILVGREALLGGSIYLKGEKTADIVATDTNVLGLIPKSIADLRDRVLFHGSFDQAHRLELASGSGFIQVVKNERGTWMLQQPLAARAAPMKVEGILEHLYDLRAEQFVTDSGADLLVYGLDDSAMKVTMGSGEKGADTTLLLGSPVAQSNQLVYAKLKNGASVFAVSSNIVGVLRVGADDLRDRRLIPMAAYDIGYFRIQEGERSLEMRRTDSGWQIMEPKQGKADTEFVSDVISSWVNVSILSFIDNAGTNLAQHGLAPPAQMVKFARRPPSTPGEHVQPEVPGEDSMTVLVSGEKRELGRALVKLQQEDSLYEILSVVLKTLSLDPLFYRDRGILALNPDDFLKITVKNGDREEAIERNPAAEMYKAVPPGTNTVDQEAVKDLVMTMSHLHASRFVSDDPKKLADYGLAHPTATVTLGLRGESGPGKTLQFGLDGDEGGAFATLRGHDEIFVLEKPAREKLLHSLYVAPAPPKEEPVDVSTNKTIGQP